MNITRENTGELTAIVKVEIEPADYSEAVDKLISDYKRKANIPGFRPGHVPTGLVKKMYGKAILAEEVNKLLSDKLMNYIKDEKLEILGNPLPNLEKNSAIDFETQTSFEFYFDLGFTPEFSIPLSEDIEVEHLEITVSEEMIDKYIEDTRKRFGKPIPSDNPESEANPETSAPADIQEPETEPAPLTPEFFNSVYPGSDIQNETDFREQVRMDAGNGFSAETDKMFFNEATEALVKNTQIQLPDTFMKRWLFENNEGKYSVEEIEKNYSSFAESMKWQLIENKLIRENQIEVKDEDIRNYIRTFMLRQINQEDADPEIQKKYDSIVDAFMQNKEQVQRINDQLYNARLLGLFKEKLGLKTRQVSYEEFIKLATEKQPHDHDHDHPHDHAHEHEHEHENKEE